VLPDGDLTFVTGESSDPFDLCQQPSFKSGADFASIAIAELASATRSSFGCWANVEKQTAMIIVAIASNRLMTTPSDSPRCGEMFIAPNQ
jgi:hypothetical protein